MRAVLPPKKSAKQKLTNTYLIGAAPGTLSGPSASTQCGFMTTAVINLLNGGKDLGASDVQSEAMKLPGYGEPQVSLENGGRAEVKHYPAQRGILVGKDGDNWKFQRDSPNNDGPVVTMPAAELKAICSVPDFLINMPRIVCEH